MTIGLHGIEELQAGGARVLHPPLPLATFPPVRARAATPLSCRESAHCSSHLGLCLRACVRAQLFVRRALSSSHSCSCLCARARSYFTELQKAERDPELVVMDTDACVFADPGFRPHAERYAADQGAFFEVGPEVCACTLLCLFQTHACCRSAIRYGSGHC